MAVIDWRGRVLVLMLPTAPRRDYTAPDCRHSPLHRRAGITDIAIALRDRDVISYGRGLVRILDRRRLEAAACECYRMMGRPAGRVGIPG